MPTKKKLKLFFLLKLLLVISKHLAQIGCTLQSRKEGLIVLVVTDSW